MTPLEDPRCKLLEIRVAYYFSVVKRVSGVDAVDPRRGTRGGGGGGCLPPCPVFFFAFCRPTKKRDLIKVAATRKIPSHNQVFSRVKIRAPAGPVRSFSKFAGLIGPDHEMCIRNITGPVAQQVESRGFQIFTGRVVLGRVTLALPDTRGVLRPVRSPAHITPLEPHPRFRG